MNCRSRKRFTFAKALEVEMFEGQAEQPTTLRSVFPRLTRPAATYRSGYSGGRGYCQPSKKDLLRQSLLEAVKNNLQALPLEENDREMFVDNVTAELCEDNELNERLTLLGQAEKHKQEEENHLTRVLNENRMIAELTCAEKDETMANMFSSIVEALNLSRNGAFILLKFSKLLLRLVGVSSAHLPTFRSIRDEPGKGLRENQFKTKTFCSGCLEEVPEPENVCQTADCKLGPEKSSRKSTGSDFYEIGSLSVETQVTEIFVRNFPAIKNNLIRAHSAKGNENVLDYDDIVDSPDYREFIAKANGRQTNPTILPDGSSLYTLSLVLNLDGISKFQMTGSKYHFWCCSAIICELPRGNF